MAHCWCSRAPGTRPCMWPRMSTDLGRSLAVSAAAAILIASVTHIGWADERNTSQAGPEQASPKSVVSMNLCTDQLAMLVAEPEQIISLGRFARDPQSSAMVKQAQYWPVNHGEAEEIFLLQPDLVLAGTFSSRQTIALLRQLNIPVIEFEPAETFDDIRDRLRQMGEVLGQEVRAEAVISEFNENLAALRVKATDRPRAAFYDLNSYTAGTGTLIDTLMEAAGLTNIAVELGLEGIGRLSLEQLVMSSPELLVTGRSFESPARAEEVLAHPALRSVHESAGNVPIPERYHICGTPFVIEAIRRLATARAAILAARGD